MNEGRATRWLARRALEAGAIDPVSFDFLVESPDRANEVLEFTQWLSGAGEFIEEAESRFEV